LIRATYFVFQIAAIEKEDFYFRIKGESHNHYRSKHWNRGGDCTPAHRARSERCIKGAGSDRLEALANRIAAAGGEATVQLDSSQSSRTTRADAASFPFLATYVLLLRLLE